jgi:hypothetical protein
MTDNDALTLAAAVVVGVLALLIGGLLILT